MLDKEYVENVIRKCDESSVRLKAEAKRISKYQKIIDLTVVFIAVGLLLYTIFGLLPSTQLIFNKAIATIFTITAAFLIIIQTSVERIILKDPPARFKDWGFYIGNYPTRIRAELAEPEVNWERIRVLIEQANLNLDKGASEWEDLVEK